MRDHSRGEFERVVIMGESTVEGGGWLQRREQRFAGVFVDLLNAFQSRPVEYFNEGVGASVISPRSSGYEDSVKPSAIERYHERVIAHRPDLFVLCYGLNDMRCGTPIDIFVEDMETIITDVRAACDPVIVLTTVYHMTGFDRWAPFDVGSVEATRAYNAAIAALAGMHDCILADVWAAEALADHLIHPDGVHANALGNQLIANRLFEAVATECTGLAAHTRELDENTEWTRRCRAENEG